MGRAGRMTALGLLALLLAPGLLAACPMCVSMSAGSGMSCPPPSGPEIHPSCCAGSAPELTCCDPVAMAGPQQAVSAPSAPLLIVPSEAALLAASLQESRAEEPLAPDDPPRDAGTALYTLHSVYLI